MRQRFSKEKYDFEISLSGNPNVGKSCIFNYLTGMNQHTGNWSGKTVSNAVGYFKHNKQIYKVVDLPGTYSLNANSQEEVIANNYIDNHINNCIVIVVDATNLERNLNLVLQILSKSCKAVLCLNMYDEVENNGDFIDLDELSLQLGVPVIATSAKKKQGFDELKDAIEGVSNNKIETYKIFSDETTETYEEKVKEIYKHSSNICSCCVIRNKKKNDINTKLDKLLTSKKTGLPIMLFLLAFLFWITIWGANYLSELLNILFYYLKIYLTNILVLIDTNTVLQDFIVNGIFTTLSWVVAVMLPPMAIFFPLFSILEDTGYLPRIAFNLDSCFSKCGAHGKQALTMAMGLGCNCCGVTGCRIIDSQREKNIAVITNSLVPCNGKLPTLIAISTIFIAGICNSFFSSIISALFLVVLLTLSVAVTLLSSKILSTSILKGQSSSFILELPPYRKPQILKTLLYSLKDKALKVLMRAVCVAIPAGAIIWCVANIKINSITMLDYLIRLFEFPGKLIGLDGVILISYILGFPANETVIPIMLMGYSSGTTLLEYSTLSQLSEILLQNGWTISTALCFLVMCLFHIPCSTTCLTILKETKSFKITMLSVLLPIIIGVMLCLIINSVFNFYHIFF